VKATENLLFFLPFNEIFLTNLVHSEQAEMKKNLIILLPYFQVNGSPSIAPASLWSRPKVQEFIQHVRTDPGSVLVVGRGETITVRVPTHENGKK
jgi:hypothetical protein